MDARAAAMRAAAAPLRPLGAGAAAAPLPGAVMPGHVGMHAMAGMMGPMGVPYDSSDDGSDPYGRGYDSMDGAPYDSDMDPYGGRHGFDDEPGFGIPPYEYGGYGGYPGQRAPPPNVNPWAIHNQDQGLYHFKDAAGVDKSHNPGPADTLSVKKLTPFPLTEKLINEGLVKLGSLDFPVKVRHTPAN